MAKHYNAAGHHSPNSLKAMVIEVITQDNRGGDRLKRLLQKETYWIHTLRATTYPGLNEENLLKHLVTERLAVSRSTLYRRMAEYNLSVREMYSQCSDEELDELVSQIKQTMPYSGYRLVKGLWRHKDIDCSGTE
ncbi:hypothetical protein WMY93_022202 [Mugilogobius chulae]|uniref:Transposase n=1 Tax=Mugilogobius chulae TaxID=88201 RepID=A0AAW0NGT6_9GOBI